MAREYLGPDIRLGVTLHSCNRRITVRAWSGTPDVALSDASSVGKGFGGRGLPSS